MENNIQRLKVFEGIWQTKGTGRQEPVITVEGTDTYKWFPGGHFMEHWVDVKMGKEHMQALEMISYDPEKKQFFLQYWNNTGSMSAMHGTVEGNSWTFFSETERGTFTFSADGRQITGTWEQSEDGGKTWKPWMDMVLTKTA
ncbi:DUF1579 family protein [Chitinophaga barathri]|uniref:DUF1579 domain-containing protein n=1 Tax=Chitinophaga barathri TaxID=1647451 RepID=A0A3N4MR90_9BACT|nr:DUF1579 family protein [Chitinophaga barathri]RPD42089.1 DUF1579 domain-containing protein [Chitinophaga barathri]